MPEVTAQASPRQSWLQDSLVLTPSQASLPCTRGRGVCSQADTHGCLQLPGEPRGVGCLEPVFSVTPPLFGWPASSVRISCVPQLGRDSGTGLKLSFCTGRAGLSGDFNDSGLVQAPWSQAQDVPTPTPPPPNREQVTSLSLNFHRLKMGTVLIVLSSLCCQEGQMKYSTETPGKH